MFLIKIKLKKKKKNKKSTIDIINALPKTNLHPWQ